MQSKEDRGYLIWAIGDDYIDCAIACARSIKLHTPSAKICLLTDEAGSLSVYGHDGNHWVFEHIVKFPFPVNYDNILANDWQVFFATPFKETIKIEADMIVPHSIEHWWTMLRHKDVVLTTGARNYMNEKTDERFYRQIFDENNLPDVYNAITYWHESDLANDFGSLVKYLFNRWDIAQARLKLGLTDPGTTDVVYAVAAVILGVENVTLPNTSYPTLIHMKGRINWLVGEDWTKEMVWELDESNIRINTIDQQYPFHYYTKEFSKVLNEHYDNIFG